jgi:anti-sigma B factor antagonist
LENDRSAHVLRFRDTLNGVLKPFEPTTLLSLQFRMDFERLEVERPFRDMGGKGVLLLKGPLVNENLPDFQNAIRRENVPTMILDFTGVPYIDSAGLGSLVSAYVSRHKSGQRTVLTGMNPRIVSLLEITRMAQLFPIFPSLADALDALSNPGSA